MQIRLLQTAAERREAYQLQVSIWGAEQSVPTNQMVVAAEIGGLVLGAFAPDGSLAGLSLAVPARDAAGGPAYLWSDILAVAPVWRGQGLGKALKWAQASHALAMGYRLIRWSYDPVQSANAALNIGTLGGTVCTYIEDMYGPMADELNRGMPTDRLVVDWAIAQVREPVEVPPQAPVVITTDSAHVREVHLDLDAPALLCPIPDSLAAVRAADAQAALAWRLAIRAALTGYFRRGYAITNVATLPTGRMAYVLTRKE